MTVLPYKESKETKKQQVREMFNNISPKYDFLNRFLSFGIDIYWRNQAVKELKKGNPSKILDVATGTGDFALAAMKVQPKSIIGVDISEQMLKVGRNKVAQKGLSNIIDLQTGDSEKLNFQDNFFDAVIVAFGVRNFENLEQGLREMNRVLRPGGKLIVLEFSKPKTFPIKQLYAFYSKIVLPFIGKIISKDKSAYTYLPDSVEMFPSGKAFIQVLQTTGYQNASCKPLTFGITSLYLATK